MSGSGIAVPISSPVSTTLFDATLDLARILGTVVESTADGVGHGTDKLHDSTRTEIDDVFNTGTIWFKDCTQTAIENTTAVITTWDYDTKIFTFPALSKTVTAGDKYAVFDGDWPRWALRQAVNAALAEIGPVTASNTALTTVADQQDYALPAGVYNLRRVELAINTASPIQYAPHFRWTETEGYLHFDQACAPGDTGYKLRLWYEVSGGTLENDADTITSLIDRERLKWTAAAWAYRWKVQRTREDDQTLMRLLGEAVQRAETEKFRHPVIGRLRKDIHMGWV